MKGRSRKRGLTAMAALAPAELADGVEGYLGVDPMSALSRCAALSANQLKSFRACHWNEPPDGYGGGTL